MSPKMPVARAECIACATLSHALEVTVHNHAAKLGALLAIHSSTEAMELCETEWLACIKARNALREHQFTHTEVHNQAIA